MNSTIKIEKETLALDNAVSKHDAGIDFNSDKLYILVLRDLLND